LKIFNSIDFDVARIFLQISIMTYDYHGTWDDYTGLNSPLYSRNDPDFSNQTGDNWKNANYSINYWISNGCPPEKINFGLAAYGLT
jgi:chitinase